MMYARASAPALPTLVVLVGLAIGCWLQAGPLVRSARTNQFLVFLLKCYEQPNLSRESRRRSLPKLGLDVRPSVYWMMGWLLFRATGDEQAAISAWEQAKTESVRRLLLVALRQYSDGHADEAIQTARLAVHLDPGNLEVLRNLTSWLFTQRNWKLASDELDQVLGAAPDNAEAYAFRGYVEYRLGSGDKAKMYLDHAISLDPDSEVVISYQVQFLLDTGGPKDQVESLLLRGDRLTGGNFYYELAKFYSGQGKYREAAPYFAKLLAKRPNDPYSRELLGGYYYQMGRYSEALEHYQAAMRLLSTEPRFYLNLGDTLRALGKEEEAKVVYCLALRLGDSRVVKEHLEELRIDCKKMP